MTNISHTIKDLLRKMEFSGAEVEEQERGGRTKVDITLRDARDLVGERGVVLAAFQHLARRIVARGVFPPPMFDIDVNNYKKMREEVLRDFAKKVALKVASEKKEVELDPMPSFDRRIVHITLAGYPDLTTESMGEGDRRCIVVRPYP